MSAAPAMTFAEKMGAMIAAEVVSIVGQLDAAGGVTESAQQRIVSAALEKFVERVTAEAAAAATATARRMLPVIQAGLDVALAVRQAAAARRALEDAAATARKLQ